MALFDGVGDGHQPRRRRHARADRRARRPPAGPAATGVVAVAAGEGLERLFAELGAHVVPGGETLNPSTYELLAGIHEVAAEEVLVLPSSSNVIMAAERACELSEKPARVVRATSQQASLLALVELDPDGRRRRERRAARAAPGGDRHRRRRPGRPRRRPGPLQQGRRGRLRRRRDRRLGRRRLDPDGDDRAARRGRRDRHRDRRRGRADPARRRSTPTSPTGSRSRPTRGASRAGGGCSRPSSGARRFAGDARADAAPSCATPRPLATAERARGRARRAPRRRRPEDSPRPRAEAGIATVGDLLYRFPRRHRDRRIRHLGDVGVGRRRPPSWSRCWAASRARSAAAACAWSASKSATRAGTSARPGSTSPGSPRSWTPAPGSCSPANAPRKGFAVTEWELLRRGGRQEDLPSEEGLGFSGPPAPTENLPPPARSGTGLKQAIASRRTRSRGCPAGLRARQRPGRARRRPPRRPLPRVPGGTRGRLRAARLRRALPPPGAARDRRSAPTAARARRPASASPGSWSGAGSSRCPSSRPATSSPPSTRSTTDLDSGEPMQRLLMGEVGSGKTVVAVYAMLRALEAGYQAALMAPTETLAEQHAITLGRLLGGGGDPVRAAHRRDPGAAPPRALDQLASGELGLIVGTHALIEPTVALRPPRPLRGRRAAPLRGRAAARARRQGGGGDGARTSST